MGTKRDIGWRPLSEENTNKTFKKKLEILYMYFTVYSEKIYFTEQKNYKTSPERQMCSVLLTFGGIQFLAHLS